MDDRVSVMWSIWESQHFHRWADLVVVGGGIVGLFSALFHKRRHPSHHVLVLEKHPFPGGASVRNAGFACFGSPSELLADMDAEGPDAALGRVEERWLGLQELRAELGDAAIGYEPTGGHEVYAAHDPLYTRVTQGFDRLNEALRPILGERPFRWDDTAVKRNGLAQVQHVAHTPLEGALDSGALMSTLLRKAQAAGVLFRGTAEVAAVEPGPAGVEVRMADGSLLHAGRVLLATNGYTAHLLPGTDVVPARGQVILTAPIPGLTLRGTFHYDEGFYYFRDHQGAVLLGGGRNLDRSGETTDVHGTTTQIQERLEQLLRDTILPGIPFTIARRWSGIMGFRAQGKEPLVQQVHERMVVAAGLSGMGVAIGIRVARRAAALL